MRAAMTPPPVYSSRGSAHFRGRAPTAARAPAAGRQRKAVFSIAKAITRGFSPVEVSRARVVPPARHTATNFGFLLRRGFPRPGRAPHTAHDNLLRVYPLRGFPQPCCARKARQGGPGGRQGGKAGAAVGPPTAARSCLDYRQGKHRQVLDRRTPAPRAGRRDARGHQQQLTTTNDKCRRAPAWWWGVAAPATVRGLARGLAKDCRRSGAGLKQVLWQHRLEPHDNKPHRRGVGGSVREYTAPFPNFHAGAGVKKPATPKGVQTQKCNGSNLYD